MKLSIQAGKTSQSVNVFLQDSSSTVGAGLTGLVYNSAGLTAYYTHAGANAGSNAITLATLAAVNSAWSSGGFKELDATNMPGWYRLDLPDAVLAAAKGRSVGVHLKGATNLAPLPLEIELTGWDNQDATAGGLSRLDAAVSSRMATFTLPSNFSSLVIDSTGRVNAFLIGILTSVFTEGATGRIAAAFKQFFNIATPAATMDHGILVDTVTTATTASALTTNNDKTGYALTSAYDPAKTAAQAGDAMALTSGERTSVGTAVWASATRTLTSFGTLAQDVWDKATSALTTAGSIGKLIVDNLNATISSRLATSGYTAPLDAAGTRSALGLASANVDTQLSTIAGYIDTEVPAIKAKTDQLTFTVANTVDSNVKAVNDSTTGVDKLSAHLPAVLKVIVAAGSTTTAVVLNSSTGINGAAPSSTDDFYNGRVLIFTSGALAGQATSVSDYTGATGTLTVVALTGAPAAAVTAVLV